MPTAFSLVDGSETLIGARSSSAWGRSRRDRPRKPTGHGPSVICRRSMFASSPKAFAWQRRTVSAFWNLCPTGVVSASGCYATSADAEWKTRT